MRECRTDGAEIRARMALTAAAWSRTYTRKPWHRAAAQRPGAKAGWAAVTLSQLEPRPGVYNTAPSPQRGVPRNRHPSRPRRKAAVVMRGSGYCVKGSVGSAAATVDDVSRE